MFLRLLIILLFIIGLEIPAQELKTGSLNGYVYDQSNGEALIGATVTIKKLAIGTYTNTAGYFFIPNIPVGEYVIEFSYIGYKPFSKNIQIKANSNSFIKINLENDAVKLGEILVSADSIRTIEKLYAKPISKIELNSRQVNAIPKAVEADLLRTLQTLPGIQPLSDFSSSLYVRGGTPDQNLYQVDGTDIYNPEHAFGIFSTFNTSAIKKVELSKGGFSAEYGGRLSSVLSVTNLDGNRNNFQGEAVVSAISASTTLQSPLGSIGSISGSIRRTYIDQTYAKFIDDIPNYYFLDGNLKAFFDLSDDDKLIISSFGSIDKLNFVFDKNIPNSPSFFYQWGNLTGSLNWRKIITPNLFANFWVTGSKFFSEFYFDELEIKEDNLINDITLKGSLEHYLRKNFNLKFGFETKFIYGELINKLPNGNVNAKRHRTAYTSYISSQWKPEDFLEIESGLRWDYFISEKKYMNLDPRFSLKYRLNELTSLKFATGIYHQYVNRIPRFFITSIWTSADEFTGGSTAYHFILGLQREIFQIYELEIETYFKRYLNVYSYNNNMVADIQPSEYNSENQPVYNNTKGLFNRGDGYSYGLEILLRKDYGAMTGWLGFSLARTYNIVDGLNKNQKFTPRQDRTFTVNLVSNINVNQFLNELKGKNYESDGSVWLLSFNFVFSTGQPITLPGSVYSVKALPDWYNNQNSVALYPSVINDARLPDYSRLDISLTWDKKFSSWSISPYIQIFNVLNRKNVWFIQYENKVKNGQIVQEIKPFNMLPILPSFGINVKF